MSIWNSSRVDTTMLTLGRVGQEVEVARIRHREPLSEANGLQGLGIVVPADDWGGLLELHVPGRGGGPYELVSLGRDADLVWEPSTSR